MRRTATALRLGTPRSERDTSELRTWQPFRHAPSGTGTRRLRAPSEATGLADVTEPAREETRDLQAFVVELGAAVSVTGETVTVVQERLTAHSGVWPMPPPSRFPNVSDGRDGGGEPTTVELTAPLAGPPGLTRSPRSTDWLEKAERGAVPPADGLRILDEIGEMGSSFRAISEHRRLFGAHCWASV